jgi:uncharacterized protein DUF3761
MLIQSLMLGLALQVVPPMQTAKPVAPAAEQAKPKIKTPKQVAKAVVRKATAKCKDDSYSFKRTDNPCEHHGGVAEWLIK